MGSDLCGGNRMIEFRHVSFRYGTDQPENSLADIDLEIGKGEFILLTGPSGCGKTTILRMISGLIPHYYTGEISGEILVNGKRIQDYELYETASVMAVVYQNPRSQFYNLDTTGEMAFTCENRGMPEKEIYARIDRTVEDFCMEELMDRNIFGLSDGEKQKIACACADVAGTEIILLDEPSANLDHRSAEALRERIIAWQKEGKTIIAAEHRISWLWDLTDRTVIMHEGRIDRVLRKEEAEKYTPEALSVLGLRTNHFEDPLSIYLPAVCDEDEVMTLRNLKLTYAGQKEPVVDIEEMNLAVGEITAITGYNGAGKTSFLNCFCGVEKEAGGTLQYHGKLYARKDRQKLCFMVMQETGDQLFTESALEEVLISFPKGKQNAKEEAVRILQSLDLKPYAERHPQSLSGGQKQRLAIACALASEREIILLDEPTSGLDHRHMQETADLLKQLCERGITVLVVTHDSELIHTCCTRMIRL